MAEQAQAGRRRPGLTVAMIAAVVAGAIALVPWAFDLVTKRGSSLVYSVNSGPSVFSQGSYKKIMVLNVKNDGAGSVKNVFAQLSLSSGSIEQWEKQIPPGLRATEDIILNNYEIEVETLNEGESFQVSFLLTLQGRNIEPQFSVRGDEVIAKLSDDKIEADKSALPKIYVAAGTAFAVLVVIMATFRISSRGSSALEILSSRSDTELHRDILAYIFQRTSLPTMAHLVRRYGGELTFRGAADAVFAQGLSQNKKERQPYITALKCILLVENIADESLEIITRSLRNLDDTIQEDEITAIRSQSKRYSDGLTLRQNIDDLITKETEYSET